MRLPDTTSRACLFLLSAFFMRAPLAVGQELPLPRQSHLAPDVRTRLAEAARDSTLAPWQRQFMLEASQGRPERAANEPPPALPSIALPAAGVAADDGGWTEVRPPSARSQHTAIYDPVRDRMVVFGGFDGGYRNDVWLLSLAGSPAWSVLAPAGSPPSARSQHTAIYDPVRDRMLVFGGKGGSGELNDVWALSLAGSSAWSALAPAGSPPPARSQHTAIYDPVRDRMLVFGGYDSVYRNDAWALSLAGSPAWSPLAPAGSPPARYQHTAIYDPVRDRMLVFGGSDSLYRNDVWTLSLAGSSAWNALAAAGTPPSTRIGSTAIYDPVRDRMVVFSGNDSSYRNDVWTLSLAGSPSWSALAPEGNPPSARYQHATIYDPVRDRMVVFGGYDGGYRNDVWALSLAESPAWSTLASTGSPPSARCFHTAIYDPVRDRMLVFGGYDASATHYRNDLWALSLAGTPAWSALAPAGTPPSARIWHTAIYDPVRDRMLVFGGYDGRSLLNDVWALSLAGSLAWTALAPAGSPPSARYSPTAFYDPVRDRMVVFGGNDGGSLRNDVWALSLAESPAWSALAPAGTPPSARYQHTAIYDSVRDRMVVFGGYDGGSPRNDVWALSLASTPVWSALAPAGTPPSVRYQHTAIYDPVRDRMVVFGGNDDISLRNDVWALSLAGTPAWSALAPARNPPPARADHPAIYDPVRDRMLVFGGYGIGYLSDLWMLVWGTTGSVPGPLPHTFEFVRLRPNPSQGETFVDFDLGVPARVVLDVFDAQGRRVNRITEWFTAGHNVISWLGDDERGHALGSGVYFIRMQVGASQTTRRMVRVR